MMIMMMTMFIVMRMFILMIGRLMMRLRMNIMSRKRTHDPPLR